MTEAASSSTDMLASLRQSIYGGSSSARRVSLHGEPGAVSAPAAATPAGEVRPPMRKPDRIIVVGGMSARTEEDKFFNVVKDLAPDAFMLPYKSVEDTSAEIKKLMNTYKDKNVLFIGHSIGATLLHNIASEAGSTLNVGENKSAFAGVWPGEHEAMYIDPPYDAPWKNAPDFVASLSPIAAAINKSAANGMAYDPANSFAWTKGKAVMWGPSPQHSPWNEPLYPGNPQRLQGLIQSLRGKIMGTPSEAVGNPDFTSEDWRKPKAVQPGEVTPGVGKLSKAP